LSFRNIDVNGDWEYGRGVASYAQGQAALVLSISTRLKCWAGNCYFDLDNGVDYLNLMGPGNEDALAAALEAVVLQTPDVLGINAFAVNLDDATRALSVTMSANTIYSASTEAELELLSSPLGS
jgi:hypothetical protein